MEYIKTTYHVGTMALQKTAAKVMTTNPVSLRDDATLAEAMAFLATRKFRGAAVINDAGRPVGFVSQSDLIAHLTGGVEAVRNADAHSVGEVSASGSDTRSMTAGQRKVLEIMSSPVITVPESLSLERVVEIMVAHRVNRVFVTDQGNTLVGVISTLDLLRGLTT